MAIGLRSIGQVMALLKAEYPDVTISKIRFLEAEGLISPERAPSGYRRYAESDIERLRYVLDAQKHHYLPLKVIKENLASLDHGEAAPDAAPDAVQEVAPTKAAPPKRAIRMTRRDLLNASGLAEPALAELERAGLITPRRGTVYYGRDQLTIAVIARKLAPYGMDARHLRVVKQAAEREVGLIEQAVTPYLRRTPTARQIPSEVMQLVLHAHAAVLRMNLSQ
ncbi:MAG: MerR family transcriptional regulator [Propionibacteriaceae bacterium]|nr:MerR family transcriptional regulator [Propionibacteriaceae bacterium]